LYLFQNFPRYMRYLTKPILSIVLGIAVVIFGFIFLLRGCLSKYDERFAKTPALYFEQGNKGVLFAIVEHQQATSYSQKGNSVQKSVSTSYYVQTNDPQTAAFLSEKKIKRNGQIKNYPVDIMGASGSNAWLFIGELMAVNAFTLETVADIKILETKNPSLTGKFPADHKYYHFNRADKNVYFTALDGSKWQLNTQTLVASPSEFNEDDSPLKQQIAALGKMEKQNSDDMDSLYQQKSLRPGQQYNDRQISSAEYNKLTTQYYKEREQLQDKTDSLRKLKRQVESKEQSTREVERAIDDLQRGTSSPSYYNLKVNQDTLHGKWYGLYGDAEFNKLYDRLQRHSENDETILRKLFTGTYILSRNDEWMIDKEHCSAAGTTSLLHAGFLLDKSTAMPVHLSAPGIFLVIHKEQIGREGKILISRMTDSGTVLWTFNTLLAEWTDWNTSSQRLFVFGTDNKNLSSSETNVLWSIDLQTGKAVKYDYFTNK
jgi:hypothetical protein